MIQIKDAKVVTEEGIIDSDVFINNDRIVDISRGKILHAGGVIDAKDCFVFPGFIDIHSDYIEHITAPRPQSMMDFSLALRVAERELVTHGITTMYHSLSFYKPGLKNGNPVRLKSNVEKLMNLITQAHYEKHLIRHRFHARLEIDNMEGVGDLMDYIDQGHVHLLSFMDHTPGQGQYRDLEKYRSIRESYGSSFTDEGFHEYIKKRQNARRLTPEECKEIADHAAQRGIPVASHDDDTVEKLRRNHEIGIRISEFPITIDVASKAKEMGYYTMAGAPNVLLGGSHSNNLCAHEAIQEGVIDILSSDYYPAAMLYSIFKLHREHHHPLHEMLKLITINPAKALGIDRDFGSIKRGKKADILVVKLLDGTFPVITSALVDGDYVYETRYR